MGRSSTDRRNPAGRPRHTGGHQSRRVVRDHRPSLRRADQPVLGAPLRRGRCPRADHPRGRRAAAGVGDRDDQPGRAADAGDRYPDADRIPGRLEDSRKEDRTLSPRDRRVRRRDDVPRAVARARPRRSPRDQAGLPERHRPRRAAVRAAQSQRAQRPLLLRRHAAGVQRARPGDQCAPIAPPPPRGFFISSTNGSRSRKITPSKRKIVTNATIDACCWTFPNSDA
jgi:hypothetical protein